MRKRVLVVLTLTMMAPGRVLEAQAQPEGLRKGTLVGASVGGGGGPSSVAMAGAFLTFVPRSGFGLEASLEGWHSFAAACIQSFPESYACDASGWSLRIGVSISPYSLGPFQPYLGVSGGPHARNGPLDETTYAGLLTGEVGGRLSLGDEWALRVGFRESRVYDDEYEDLMNEKLRLSLVTLGLDFRPSS